MTDGNDTLYEFQYGTDIRLLDLPPRPVNVRILIAFIFRSVEPCEGERFHSGREIVHVR